MQRLGDDAVDRREQTRGEEHPQHCGRRDRRALRGADDWNESESAADADAVTPREKPDHADLERVCDREAAGPREHPPARRHQRDEPSAQDDVQREQRPEHDDEDDKRVSPGPDGVRPRVRRSRGRRGGLATVGRGAARRCLGGDARAMRTSQRRHRRRCVARLQRSCLTHLHARETAVAALPVHVHEPSARSDCLLLARAYAVAVATSLAQFGGDSEFGLRGQHRRARLGIEFGGRSVSRRNQAH